MRTFIGIEGHYEIDDEGRIVFKCVDDSGRITGEIRKFKDIQQIKNHADRNGVLHLIQLMRIHRTIGTEYLKVQ